MYILIAKSKILKAMHKHLVDNGFTPKYPFEYNELLSFSTINNTIFGKAASGLAADGYIVIFNAKNGTCNLRITAKGISAATSGYFMSEYWKVYGKVGKEFALLICNIVVAWAAIKALSTNATSSQKEIQSLSKRLDSITLRYSKELLKPDTVVYQKNQFFYLKDSK